MKKCKIGIGLTSVDYNVHWGIVASLFKMLHRDFSNFEFEPFFSQGIYIAEVRNRICVEFLNSDCDFLFFLDYDNGLSEDWLDLFMSDFEDPSVNIVSGVYEFKTGTEGWVAGVIPQGWEDGHYRWLFEGAFLGDLLNLTKLSDGAAVGAGCLMIRRAALEGMPFPYFETKYVPNRLGVMFWGEDTGFCKNAENSGFDIHLDTRIRSPHMAGNDCFPEGWRQFQVVQKMEQKTPLPKMEVIK